MVDTKPTFKVDLADALASAAFESYYKPQGWLLFQNTRPKKTLVTYTDNKFLAKRYTRALEVRLLSASKLPPADVGGSAHPYAALTASCGGEAWAVTSSTVSGSLDPAWNETYYLCLRGPSLDGATLKVQLYDKDRHTGDDPLGEAELSLEELDGSSLVEYELPLKAPAGAGQHGFLHSIVSWLASWWPTFGGRAAAYAPGAAAGAVRLSCRLSPLASFAQDGEDDAPENAKAPQASPTWLRFLRTSVGRADDLHRPDYLLAETYSGVLEVTLQGAAGLPAFDLLNGKADPFVSLSLESGGEAWSVTSPVRDATLAPEWNETYYLRIRNAETDALRLRVYDKDWLRRELMGEAVLSLGEVGFDGSSAVQEVEVQLRSPDGKKAAGTVSLRLRLWEAEFYNPAEDEEVAPPRHASAALGVLSPVAYVDCTETDTQAWLYWNRTASPPIAVIAFRGTQPTHYKDVFTDLGLLPTRWDDEAHAAVHEHDEAATAERESTTAGAKTVGWHGGGGGAEGASRAGQRVHGGFHASYDSVRDVVFELLEAVRATRDGPWRVLVTGHSLGGALATLAAYELAERRPPADPPITMYTYGAPRVGNKAFAEAFNRLVPDAWRCTNDSDIVPRVPRLMGYCHVGKAVLLYDDGTAPAVGLNREECIEGKWLRQVFGEVVRGAFQMSLFEVLGQFTKEHKHFMVSLFSGRGVMQHLGDFYVKTLRAAQELPQRASAVVEAATETVVQGLSRMVPGR